ncbi:MAG: hypothetical protein K2J97_01725 [Muribaculaceae bacterium]|nr:hypothetical protein [Muribaculaceae bacterium]
MQSKKRHSGRFLAILLTLLFVAYYSGATLFIHTHFINSGAITHSHPYLPDKHHSHSTNEYEALSFLCNFVAEEIDFPDIPEKDELLLGVFIVEQENDAPVAPYVELTSRAPPMRFI